MGKKDQIEDQVVLVDSKDREIGLMNKLEAHKKGVLHRAVSLLLIDKEGSWLLQKRSSLKYHSPLHIANSCCTHPFVDELPRYAAARRAQEELNIEVDPASLISLGSFLYRAEVGGGLIEHELDHLFIKIIDKEIRLNPNLKEVEELFWLSFQEVQEELRKGSQSRFIWASWVPYLVDFFSTTTFCSERNSSL